MIDGPQVTPQVSEDVPISEFLTDYDRRHLKTYLRLLDALGAGATPDEMCLLILGVDPHTDPARAQRVLDSHLRRAKWMVEAGYRGLANTTSENPDIAPPSERDQKL